jgi:hypothetical protein
MRPEIASPACALSAYSCASGNAQWHKAVRARIDITSRSCKRANRTHGPLAPETTKPLPRAGRSGLDQADAQRHKLDVVVTWAIARLGGSLIDLLGTILGGRACRSATLWVPLRCPSSWTRKICASW